MKKSEFHYCESLTNYKRFATRPVALQKIALGGNNPLRLQSMTNTSTADTEATVQQSIEIAQAGADYVRITAPTIKQAQNLKQIKNHLRSKGFETPLIADIHFSPKAAEISAAIVEKIRINPGNYTDKRAKDEQLKLTDEEFDAQTDKIRQRLRPLLEICKKNHTAIRIGTNHGSLSDRIMSRYGDTPQGMVESAMEFLRICQQEKFHDVVISLKSSNTRTMVHACRLLVRQMKQEGMNYPLHLGVTEAGEGEDGRIKSAVGIGTLLADGIGDTIRISLTEAPQAEIPVAQKLRKNFESYPAHPPLPHFAPGLYPAYEYKRRQTYQALCIGGENTPVVVACMPKNATIDHQILKKIGYTFDQKNKKYKADSTAADFILLDSNTLPVALPKNLKVIAPYENRKPIASKNKTFFPLFSANQYIEAEKKSEHLNFIHLKLPELTPDFIGKIKTDHTAVLLASSHHTNPVGELRAIVCRLIEKKAQNPLILLQNYGKMPFDDLQLKSAAENGALFIDGLADGIALQSSVATTEQLNTLSFGILQASRVRTTKTEYISCPSCGRTLFDLEKVTAQIKQRTAHLKGLKIGIMGCIVNGPGEMADADYGYVGSGKNKVSLYKGKKMVQSNINSNQAVDELIALIKANNDWQPA